MTAPEDAPVGGATSPAQGSPAPAVPAEISFSTPGGGGAAPTPVAPGVDSLLLQQLLSKFSNLEATVAEQKQRLEVFETAQGEISGPEGIFRHGEKALREIDFLNAETFRGSVTGYRNVEEPGAWESNAPHLYDLNGDPTWQKLNQSRSGAARDEYRLLACTTYYLSGTISVLDETFTEILEALPADSQLCGRINQIFNSLEACESWYRKRLGYIRYKSSMENPETEVLNYLQKEIYGWTDGRQLGSEQIDGFVAEFERSRGKAVVAVAAQAAAKRSVSQGDGDAPRGKFGNNKNPRTKKDSKQSSANSTANTGK